MSALAEIGEHGRPPAPGERMLGYSAALELTATQPFLDTSLRREGPAT